MLEMVKEPAQSKQLRLWQFWTGPMPGYVKVATNLMRRLHGPAYTLLTEKDLPDYGLSLGDFSYVAHVADALRMEVLRRHGGLYVDADCIPRCNLLEVVGQMISDGAEAGCVLEWDRTNTLDRPTGLQCSFAFAAAPEHPFFVRCCEEIAAAKAAGKTGWTDTNGKVYTKAYAETPRADKERFAIIDWRSLAPVPSCEWGLYAARGNDRVLASILQNPAWHECWAIMLYNAMMCSELGHMPADVFLKSDCVIAEVCRQLLASVGAGEDTAYDLGGDHREL